MLLYHLPGSRSSRVLWALEETGAEYELVPVPVAEIDGSLLFETAALCLYIAETHSDAGLLPAVGTMDRARVYQWISFGLTEIEPGVVEVFRSKETDPARAEAGKERVTVAAAVVEDALADGRDYLLGDAFTIADIICGGTLFGSRRFEIPLGENTNRFLDRLAARPARKRAYPTP
jgi:glutathione S-transferase